MSRRAPGPRGRRLLGSLLDVKRDRLRFVTRVTREYGDLVCFRMGPRRLFLLNHPDHFRHVLQENPKNYRKGIGLSHARPLFGDGLLTSDGELWSRQRPRLQPSFRRDQLEDHVEAMTDAAMALVERLRRAARRGEAVGVPREMARFTLDVLDRTLLRLDLGGEVDRLIDCFDVLGRWAMRSMASLMPLPLAVPTPANRRARRALSELDARIEERLAARRRAGPRGDVLDRLLAAEPPLPAALVRDEVVTLLVAGHETSAAVLSWACDLLARHPEVRERMREELAAELAGRRPAMADLPRLAVTRMVVEETLRLYPPVWLLPRRAVADDEIGGYPVAAGSDVLLSVYSLHRHPGLWRRPDDFWPERFAPEHAAGRPAHAYLPFGAGPRACLGRVFGRLEVQLALACLGQHLRLEPIDAHPAVAEPLLTLHARGLRMRPVAT